MCVCACDSVCVCVGVCVSVCVRKCRGNKPYKVTSSLYKCYAAQYRKNAQMVGKTDERNADRRTQHLMCLCVCPRVCVCDMVAFYLEQTLTTRPSRIHPNPLSPKTNLETQDIFIYYLYIFLITLNLITARLPEERHHQKHCLQASTKPVQTKTDEKIRDHFPIKIDNRFVPVVDNKRGTSIPLYMSYAKGGFKSNNF